VASFGNTAELPARFALIVTTSERRASPSPKPTCDGLASTMSSDEAPNPMAESGVTIRSDSEQYSGEDIEASPPSSSSPAVILYQPPTLWSLLRGATINLFLPFVNGMMLGFGELFAHEAAFRLGWSGTRVCHDPVSMSRQQEARQLTWKWPDLSPFTTTNTSHWAWD
jgi:hypothetical protein